MQPDAGLSKAAAGGLRTTQAGGDAQVLPTANPDQLALFKTRQLHYGRELQAMEQVIGLLADRILFSPWERFLHRRWGTNTP